MHLYVYESSNHTYIRRYDSSCSMGLCLNQDSEYMLLYTSYWDILLATFISFKQTRNSYHVTRIGGSISLNRTNIFCLPYSSKRTISVHKNYSQFRWHSSNRLAPFLQSHSSHTWDSPHKRPAPGVDRTYYRQSSSRSHVTHWYPCSSLAIFSVVYTRSRLEIIPRHFQVFEPNLSLLFL